MVQPAKSGLAAVAAATLFVVAVFAFSLYLGTSDVSFLDGTIDFLAPLLEPFYRENERAIVELPNPRPVVAALGRWAETTG